MIHVALAVVLAQVQPTMPPMPSQQQMQQTMQTFERFRPAMEESRRRLLTAIDVTLPPLTRYAIGKAIGADAVAYKPDTTVLAARIDRFLTPGERTAIAAAFTEYSADQAVLLRQMTMATPMMQSGNVKMMGPMQAAVQPAVFAPSDAARLLAQQPLGMGSMLHAVHFPAIPAGAAGLSMVHSMVSPMMESRTLMRARMLASLSPLHRAAIGECYGRFAMNVDERGGVYACVDAQLSPAERQSILAARAEYVAESAKQMEQMKAQMVQQVQAMGAEVPPAFLETMKKHIESMHAQPLVPVTAARALVEVLTVLPPTASFDRSATTAL